ncbi:MAG: hypothetical protein KGN16_15015 [Burkholderiales bacterium]|nr:hypothetical protein [Burkholderiales bacterium]
MPTINRQSFTANKKAAPAEAEDAVSADTADDRVTAWLKAKGLPVTEANKNYLRWGQSEPPEGMTNE